MAKYDFSIPRHIQFLAGYLDAVGRSLTTDGELVSLTCVDASEIPLELIDHKHGGDPIENWSAEFCAVADDFLRVGARTRLGFYLVEYLCWFKDFTQDASCYRGFANANDVVSEIAYRIEWPDGSGVLFTAGRSKR